MPVYVCICIAVDKGGGDRDVVEAENEEGTRRALEEEECRV